MANNDTFRKVYTPLDEEQKAEMAEIKDKAQQLLDIFNTAVPTDERSERSRCMAVARTNLEQTIMWVVKAVTTEKGDNK
jgi:molybdenum cofactor biosynthesis enzyme